MAELLAILIRQNESIKGIQIDGSDTKLTQFADDVTCFLATEDSLPKLMDTLHLFSGWSGLKINTNKTKIICPRYLQEGRSHILGMPIVYKTKILGIWMGVENSEANS